MQPEVSRRCSGNFTSSLWQGVAHCGTGNEFLVRLRDRQSAASTSGRVTMDATCVLQWHECAPFGPPVGQMASIPAARPPIGEPIARALLS